MKHHIFSNQPQAMNSRLVAVGLLSIVAIFTIAGCQSSAPTATATATSTQLTQAQADEQIKKIQNDPSIPAAQKQSGIAYIQSQVKK